MFSLDARLAGDTVPVGGLALSDVRLMRDARFAWAVLVPRLPDAVELTDLTTDQRNIVMDEIARTSAALRAVAPCDKINVGALGNIVRQMHIHVVARRVGDVAWPGPVWGSGPAGPYAPAELDRIVNALRAILAP